jgi:Electron transfer DM13
MTRGLWRNPAFWAIAVFLVALGLFLAFAVFGIQTLFYDTEVNEDFGVPAPASAEQGSRRADSAAASNPVVISSGEFHPVAHPGKGDAIVYRLGDGSHVLRLENLDIFNGPALYVYAVGARDAKDSETVEEVGFLNLGPLKGNRGNQTYELPPEFDPDRHRSISVWCKRFSVNFATVPLR